MLFPKLHLEEEEVRLRLIEEDQGLRPVERDLPGQFRPDRAGGPGDEHRATRKIRGQLRQRQLNRLSTQEVLDPHIAQLIDTDVASQHLGDSRQDLERKPGPLAQLHDPPELDRLHRRHRDDHHLGALAASDVRQVAGCADHVNPVDRHPPLGPVVVHEPHRSVPGRYPQHLARQQVARVSRADDEHPPRVPVEAAPEMPQALTKHPVRNPQSRHQKHGQDPFDHDD